MPEIRISVQFFHTNYPNWDEYTRKSYCFHIHLLVASWVIYMCKRFLFYMKEEYSSLVILRLNACPSFGRNSQLNFLYFHCSKQLLTSPLEEEESRAMTQGFLESSVWKFPSRIWKRVALHEWWKCVYAHTWKFKNFGPETISNCFPRRRDGRIALCLVKN